jgi:hypothetical protein
VLPPELKLQPVGPYAFHIAGGLSAPIQAQARLDWLDNGKLPMTIQPADAIRLRVGDGATFDVPYTVGSRTFDLVSSDWTNLDFQFQIPKGLEPETYQGKLALLFRDEPLKPELPFEFHVNRLNSHGLVISPLQLDKFGMTVQPETLANDPVRIVQFFDQDAALKLSVRCAIPDIELDTVKLVPLQESGAFPFLQNASDARDYVAPPTFASVSKDVSTDSLVIELLLPRVRNATPGAVYKSQLDFEYRDPDSSIDLGKLSIPLEVIFVDPRAVLTVAPAAKTETQEE